MSHLPSLRDTAANLSGHGPSGYRPPARVERATRYGVAVEQGRALVAAARVRAVEYVSLEAVDAVDRLTELEELYGSRSPLSGMRARVIVDTATLALARIVMDTARY